MGSGRFDSRAYTSYTADTASYTREDRFKSRETKKELNPHGVKIRESRDSADNPLSNAIIVALDVTGSMGVLAEVIASKSLGVLFQKIFDEEIVTDPHLMFMGIGDANYDRAPLQVSQFEADNRIVEQLTGLYLEGGGGGNDSESYHLAWYFAARHTSIDCFEKRGRKGYLFTVGDEKTPPPLRSHQINAILGDTPEVELSAAELLVEAQRTYHVYHIIIEEGNYARGHLAETQDAWRKLLGQNALSLKDHTKLTEGIVAIIKMNEEAMGYGKSTAPSMLPDYVAPMLAAR
jgi:hypothetical protein